MDNVNRDFLYGLDYNRASYAISGRQPSVAQQTTAGKLVPNGPPMYVDLNPPGIFTDAWQSTFGASLDATMAIINGQKVQEAIDSISLNGIYRDGSSNAFDNNTWIPVSTDEADIQQISMMVSKPTIEEYDDEETYGSITGVRGIGVRIPSIAGGWGRTIDGLPTDPQTSEDSTGRRNDEVHKLARETWKFGPVDYRWDYRRGVWSAYNDLVADNQDVGIGTWVFGTNPDSDQGYPFIRGRLEDVWWVRKTFEKSATNGRTQGAQTAEVMTKLTHRLFDEEENGAASLSSVFIIPHSISTDDDLHPKGEEYSVGGEITGDGEAIDIRTTVHFFQEIGKDGPIKFGAKASEEDVCCKPNSGKYFVGEMLWMDVSLNYCESAGSDPRDLPAGPVSDEPDRMWVPAIKIDECELVGQHFLKFVQNDINLAVRISETCNEITRYTENLKGAIDGNFLSVGVAIDCLNREVQGLAASTTTYVNQVIVSTNDKISKLKSDVQTAMNQLVANIKAALEFCGCEAELFSPIIGGQSGPVINLPLGGISVGSCTLTLGRVPALDCAICHGTHLQGPCMDDENFVAGRACDNDPPPVPTTKFGNCGAK